MTFFFTAIFIFLVFWRPQEWLFPWLFGWPILDAIVFMALLSLLIESDQRRIRFPKNRPQIYLLFGLWIAAITSHVVHTYFIGMMETIPAVFKICFFTILLFCVQQTHDKPHNLYPIPQNVYCVAYLYLCILSYQQEPLYLPFDGT